MYDVSVGLKGRGGATRGINLIFNLFFFPCACIQPAALIPSLLITICHL